MTDVQHRILEDLVDENPATRHSRSTLAEFKANAPEMLRLGLIAHGDPKKGRWHFVTKLGKAALAAERQRSPS